jgi:uncharacterized cupredoxin-like copper-binding protein
MKTSLPSLTAIAVLISMALNISVAFAHDEKPKITNASASMSMQADAMGKPGVAKNVTRTIMVTLADTMRFTPNAFPVKLR